ncbi:DUF4435 domain-containing protein [Gemmata sp. JC673]|uniref:DUF4435 domain-containing protein n=1 Tax=Gemmata algarum TaxID=2975278 RepID=A0ABU5F0I1_9BACT|nr:hypothetical protein [Gemmata algarum]MDY3560911.1 DUF4435 domain-containing protein [Gemmata algarum]
MTAVAHLSSFYSAAPIVLWVEDVVTRDYLTKVWGDPAEIAFFIAGGNTAVRPAVETARREGIGHVFGLIDRDFGHTNIASWANLGADIRIFYPPRHEIENYTLDAAALAGCSLHNRRRTGAQITTRLEELVAQQPAWLACRRVVTEMRTDVLGNFPEHPSLAHVTTVAQAEQHITGSDWFAQIAGRVGTWATAGHVSARLRAAEANFTAALASGAWLMDFSGKEIFRRVREYVYQPPQNPGSPDSDFAKTIGEWQLTNNVVPADLTQLHSALRVRVGLAP